MLYFQRNCSIFNVKILKEVRFSESLLILLEIRFVWNNGGQLTLRNSTAVTAHALACENIRFSSLFAAGDVSRNVPSGEERGETDVFAGYPCIKKMRAQAAQTHVTLIP